MRKVRMFKSIFCLFILVGCFGGAKFKAGDCISLPDNSDPNKILLIHADQGGNYQLKYHQKDNGAYVPTGASISLRSNLADSKYVKAPCPR